MSGRVSRLSRLDCVRESLRLALAELGEHHTTLQTRRQEQQTKPFKQRMRHRHAIEGTQSQWVRDHGWRQARYCGLPKAKLQNYVIGAACNIKPWLRYTAWELQNGLTAALSTATANSRSQRGRLAGASAAARRQDHLLEYSLIVVALISCYLSWKLLSRKRVWGGLGRRALSRMP